MKFICVYIIGFGQMGQSIANTIKKNNFNGKIFVSSRKKTENCNFIDGFFDINDLNINYDNSIIFVCTPPSITEKILKQMLKIVANSKNCVITDTCSVKKQVAKIRDKNFISIHQMDGGNSDKNTKMYFKKNVLNYVINDNLDEANKELLQELLTFCSNFLNCKNELVSSIFHDKIVAFTSHLQNLILASYHNNFAKIDIQMWHEVFKQNRENIEYFLKLFLQKMQNRAIGNKNLADIIFDINNEIMMEEKIDIETELFNPSLTNVFSLKDNNFSQDNEIDDKIFIENMSDFFNKLTV